MCNLHCNHKAMQDPLADTRVIKWLIDCHYLNSSWWWTAATCTKNCVCNKATPFTTPSQCQLNTAELGKHLDHTQGFLWTKETSLKQSPEALDTKRRITEAVKKLQCFAKGDTGATEQNLKQGQETEISGLLLGQTDGRKQCLLRDWSNTHKVGSSKEKLQE